MIKQINN